MSLLDIWSVLEDSAWLTFFIFAGIGALGLAALFMLYPFSAED